MLWVKFSEEQPTKNGKYVIAYTLDTWRSAEWENGKWLGDPDRYGYHILCTPIWWANIIPPQQKVKGGLDYVR